MRLISKLEGGGDHPGSGCFIPRKGQAFELDLARAALVIYPGLATVAAVVEALGETKDALAQALLAADNANAEPRAWHGREANVYHREPGCKTGNNVEAANRVSGAGGKRLCRDCYHIAAERLEPLLAQVEDAEVEAVAPAPAPIATPAADEPAPPLTDEGRG